MDPEHIIDETATIKGTDIEKVYDDCASWIKKRASTQILTQSRPTHLKARSHIRPNSGLWARWMLLELSLKKEETNTIIMVKMTPEKLSPFTFDLHRLDFPKTLEALWKHLDIEIDDIMLRRLYPYSELIGEITWLRPLYVVSIVPFLLGLSLFLSDFNSQKFDENFFIIISLFCLGFLNLLVAYRKRKNILIKLRDIYPDRSDR